MDGSAIFFSKTIGDYYDILKNIARVKELENKNKEIRKRMIKNLTFRLLSIITEEDSCKFLEQRNHAFDDHKTVAEEIVSFGLNNSYAGGPPTNSRVLVQMEGLTAESAKVIAENVTRETKEMLAVSFSAMVHDQNNMAEFFITFDYTKFKEPTSISLEK